MTEPSPLVDVAAVHLTGSGLVDGRLVVTTRDVRFRPLLAGDPVDVPLEDVIDAIAAGSLSVLEIHRRGAPPIAFVVPDARAFARAVSDVLRARARASTTPYRS
jgi:hypothetical protein